MSFGVNYFLYFSIKVRHKSQTQGGDLVSGILLLYPVYRTDFHQALELNRLKALPVRIMCAKETNTYISF